MINLKEHNKYGYRSYVLLEELFHCYQRQKDIHSVHPFPGIHYEIEVKVGWMMYRERIGKPLSKELQQKAFFTKDGTYAMRRLIELFESNIQSDNPIFQQNYELMIRALTENNNIKDYKSYTFSTFLPDWNFNLLEVLMEACSWDNDNTSNE